LAVGFKLNLGGPAQLGMHHHSAETKSLNLDSLSPQCAAMSAAIDIRRIATLSRLALTPEEEALYSGQLTNILKHMDVLSAYDLSKVEPSAHAMPVFDVWREDVSRPGFDADQALANAPRRSGDQFQITKVVE
jgi:aspartyl-tRNA(Asn)/glutamyl-tRNA(Gln) amidotransferase subunit C